MKRELALAFVFLVLSVTAFSPLILIALGEYDGNVVERLESLLSDRQELLIALGTLFLILGLSVWSSHLSNRSAEKRDVANRVLQAELKVADFRQSWIAELRNELEEFYQLTFTQPNERDNKRLSAVIAKVRMRLNLEEPAARELYLAMLHAAKHDNKDMEDAVVSLINCSEKANVFLRNEWGRLKRDIRDALTFKEDER